MADSPLPSLWIGVNWKMNKTAAEGRLFAETLSSSSVFRDPRLRCFVLPPFTLLRESAAALSGCGVQVGGQSLFHEDWGAWTGEISAPMLKDGGAAMVAVGHSERRRHFGETDEMVGLKVAAALRHGLVPLICVGETAEDREAGRADAVLARQLEAALRLRSGSGSGLSGMEKETEIVLAYEPVWAIGVGGAPAHPDYAEARHAALGRVSEALLGRRVPCLYGGSVDLESCEAFVEQGHIDGLLIGRAAWEAEACLAIVEHCLRTL